MDKEILIPYIINGEHINKILEEDLNDLTKGTKVFAYVSITNSKKKLEDVLSENIAWLDINHIQYRKIHGVFTMEEYNSWINDEPKTSLKIRNIVIRFSSKGTYTEYEEL